MKPTYISIILVVLLIGGAFFLTQKDPSEQGVPANNVSIVDGKQIIEIKTKGGYFPRNSVAKAGMPTILRFNTSGTFDCSSSIRIPSMGISKLLPQTGATDIAIGSSTAGALQGSCGMGMYPFQVEFE